MIHTGSFERLKASFALQFEPDGQGYLYRKGQKGPAIRVNAEERDDFIADYARALKLGGWAVFGITILVGASAGVVAARYHLDLSRWSTTGMIALIGAFSLGALWLRGAPDRALRYRVPTYPGLSTIERKRLAFAKINYGILAMGVVGAGVVIWLDRDPATWRSANGLWITGAVVCLALILVQGFRKWRFEQRDRHGGV